MGTSDFTVKDSQNAEIIQKQPVAMPWQMIHTNMEIANLEKEIEIYNKKINDIKGEMNLFEAQTVKSSELTMFAYEKCKQMAEHIRDTLDKEAQELNKEADEIMQQNKTKISELKNMLETNKTLVYSTFNSILDKINEISVNEIKTVNENPSLPDDFISNINLEKMIEEVEKSADSNDVPVISDYMKNSAAAEEHEVKPIIDTGKLIETKERIQAPQNQMPMEQELKKQTYEDAVESGDNGMQSTAFESTLWDGNNKGDTDILKTTDEAPKAEKTDDSAQPLGNVAGNILNDKYLYIAGKISGIDIFDNTGKLIIAENEVITQESIIKAENEGKIIEMIINMRLQ